MAYRPITLRLADTLFTPACEALAELLAEEGLSVRHAALKAEVPERTLVGWLVTGKKRGVDIRALAQQKLKARGVNPNVLPAERIRGGMIRSKTEGRSLRKDRARRMAARAASTAES